MNNCYLLSPIKVSLLNLKDNAARNTLLIFINTETPNYIINILKKNDFSAKDKGDLKNFYGVNWRRKLGFEEEKSGGSGRNDDEHVENRHKIDELSAEQVEKNDYQNLEFEGGCCNEFLEDDKSNDLSINKSNDKFTTVGAADDDDIFISEEDLLQPVGQDKSANQQAKSFSISAVRKKQNKVLSAREFIFDIDLFPEDNIFTLKEKIFLASGIPIYRQHLFWSGGISGREVSYNVYTESGQRGIDIIQAFNKCNTAESSAKAKNSSDFTVPIDTVLYNNKDNIKVECLDYFKLITHCNLSNMKFTVVDMQQFFEELKSQLDNYRLDLYYFGFVIKFWPMITRDVFTAFLENEDDIFDKYPEMSRPESTLRDKFTRESNILNFNYGRAEKVMKMSKSMKIKTSIISLIGTITPIAPTLLSLRNLFNYITVTRCFPESHCYVNFEGYDYHLRKINIQNKSNITFPPEFRTGFVFAVSLRKMDQDSFHERGSKMTLEKEQTRYLFLNIMDNGTYNIKSVWNEEEEQSFESIIVILQRFINPIINMINAAGSTIFSTGSLPLVSTRNILIKSVTSNIIWNKFINETKFRNLAMFWDDYIRAGIIENRTIISSGRVNNRYDYIFKKGMHNFSPAAVENNLIGPLLTTLQNQYSHLSVNNAWQRWKQFYSGRFMSMIHRTSDVKFEILGINIEELALFVRYIYVFLGRFICSKGNEDSVKSANEVGRSIKKIKKLKEVDPELYNLKKYGYKRAYSVICQNPKQPVVFSEDEIGQLSKTKISSLYRYWNFTTGKEALYSCPNPKYPHLFFITGVHPKNYCLPCCKKTADSIDGKNSKNAAISTICAKKHFFDKNTDLSELLAAGKQRHIINYGRILEENRIARLPNELVNTLFQEQDNLLYVIFGVKQSLPAYPGGDLGIIFSIAECLQMSISTLAKNVMDTIRSHPKIISSICGGGIIEKYFSTVDNLFYLIEKIFISQEIAIINKNSKSDKMKELLVKNFHAKDWCNLFLEIIAYRLNTYVIIFEDITLLKAENEENASAKEAIFNIIVDKKLPITNDQIAALRPSTKIIFIVNKGRYHYPIFYVDDREYYKNKVPKSRFFSHKSHIFTSIMSEVTSARRDEILKLTFDTLVDFTKATSGNTYTIKEKYINLNSLCYAAKVESKKGIIIVALRPTPYRSDNFCITFAPYSDISTSAALTDFVKDYNKWVTSKSSGVNIISFSKKIISADKKFLFSDEGIWPIDSLDSFKDLKEKKYSFNISDINKSIFKNRGVSGNINTKNNNANANNWRNRIGAGLYKNYLYQLFIIQFINEMHNNHRNEKARLKVRKLFCDNKGKSSGEDLFELLQGIEDMTKKDASRISLLIQNLYSQSGIGPKELFESIDNAIWDFDKKDLFDLIKMVESGEDVIQKLKSTCSKFITIIKDNNIKEFPNILTACSDNSGDICKGKKLVLPSEETFDKYVGLLAADLKNPLKVKLILLGHVSKNIINFFDFNPSQYERIYIID